MKTFTLRALHWKNNLLFPLLLTSYGTGFFMMTFIQTGSQMAWYEGLKHSFFTPPGYVFSIVWTFLYALIAISAFIIWKKSRTLSKSLYFAQLILQILWSYTFFHLHETLISSIVLIVLCLFILFMIANFSFYSKKAALLLLPYFLWSLFATYLNFATFILN